MSEITIDQIKPNAEQPRKHFDQEALQELADSIQEIGLLNPILVRPNGSGYEVVHGERRWRACQLAGLESIRADVRDLDDETAFLIAFTENLQRDDLNPMEEAEAMQALMDRFAFSQAEVGRRIGKSQQYIAGRLALLRLPEPVREMVTTRVVNPSLGRTLAGIPDERWQVKMAKQAGRGELTNSDLASATRQWQFKNDAETRKASIAEYFTEVYPELAQFAEAVRKEEIIFEGGFDVESGYLQIVTARKKFTGQTWDWPKYSGQELIIGPGNWSKTVAGLDDFGELPDVPLFTEQEWSEFCGQKNDCFSVINAGLSHLGKPGSGKHWADIMRPPQKDYVYRTNEADRRDYDPDYGRFLIEANSPGDPAFIKRGWGAWSVIDFNDGQGKRTRRRFFAHDSIGRTLVEELAQTVDPFAFSTHNFKQMSIWKATPSVMSWWYIRRKTITKEDAIAALEADLEKMRNAQPLTDAEFDERLLDELQAYKVGGMQAADWREGVQTYPRFPDGSVDPDAANEVYLAVKE